MKSNLIKLSVFCFTLLVSVFSFAQKDFQGKAYYFSKTTVDMNNFGRPGMSEDQKKTNFRTNEIHVRKNIYSNF